MSTWTRKGQGESSSFEEKAKLKDQATKERGRELLMYGHRWVEGGNEDKEVGAPKGQ